MCKENLTKESPLAIRGAIFDMDGTLLDSMWIWEHYASQYIRSRGLCPAPELDERLGAATLGEAAEYLCRTYRLPETPEETEADIARTVTALYGRVEPMPGIPDLLAAFSAAGVRMAVATLTEREDAERVLSRLGLLSYFDGIFTCTEVGAPKTRPDVFLRALAALGTPQGETAVFEDAPYALHTAHAAGFPTVAVGAVAGADAIAASHAFLTVGDYRAVPWGLYLPKKP